MTQTPQAFHATSTSAYYDGTWTTTSSPPHDQSSTESSTIISSNTTKSDVIDSFYFYEVSAIPCQIPKPHSGFIDVTLRVVIGSSRFQRQLSFPF